jgi:hypothetical protein
MQFSDFFNAAQDWWRRLGQLKRSMFKEIMRDLVRDVHGVALRNDVPDSENKQQQGWKGLAVVDAEVLTA